MVQMGGIYTEENCPICGKRMEDDHRDAVRCKKHKSQIAQNLIIRFGRDFYKRTQDYAVACRILNGLRFKHGEGTYDPRDYKADNPLGLEKQIEKYLEMKEKKLKEGSLKTLRPRIRRIKNYFGHINVKEIGYAEIEDFLLSQEDIGGKTRDCLKSILHDFYHWMKKRKVILESQIPEFPAVEYSLGFRKLISKDVQTSILEEVKRITPRNPRIYLGCLWLATYINLRPSELLTILEEHVDHGRKVVWIATHKTDKKVKEPKFVPLLPEHYETLKELPRGFPQMHLFRHDVPVAQIKAGEPFGTGLLYDTWKRACDNLGIKGVDLYGGTRHSSATAIRRFLSREDTKELTGHHTNAAFERYIEQDIETLRRGYELTKQRTTDAPPVTTRKPL